MLTQLNIQNFAIIDNLDLDIPTGMTVITGETGAGKSIAIDALGLTLGDRADAGMVKHGSKRSDITASFDLSKIPQAIKWLKEQELDNDGECLLRRTISSEGGSRAYINGRPVPLQMVKSLSEKIIDIHSQHQHQSLLRNEEQRQLLDNYGGQQPLAQQVKQAYQQWHQLSKEYQALTQAAAERASRIDFLQFQIQELNELNIQENEWPQLEQEHRQMANMEKIQQTISISLDELYNNEDNINLKLEHVRQQLSSLSDYLPHIEQTQKLLETATINIDEAIDNLRHQGSDEQFNPEQFEYIESRMASLLDIARKHRCQPEELNQLQNSLDAELQPLINADQTLDKMESQISQARTEYDALATKLSKERSKAANKLKKACEKILVDLGMKDARLNVQLATLENNGISPFGNEKISFEICTNPGSPFKPLAKVASGGELSRISLAIQVVTSKVTNIPTLIFDEVDVGIGGGVAEVVGKLLRQLGEEKQIICITHQAQVAAQGNEHWVVEKQKQAKQVSTKITCLNKDDREIEIARMIGGIKLTAATQKHAKEMLKNAQAI